MVCHTGGPHFPNGVPIFPVKMGTRGPHFRGSPFSHDTGNIRRLLGAKRLLKTAVNSANVLALGFSENTLRGRV